MVGYSRHIERDESGTITRQKNHFEAIMNPSISEHAGRVVKLTGDGALVEFGSAVDAVHCAVEVQQGLAESEAAVPSESRILYRVGINVGDIVIDGDDILGDGVNVAARLEALAEPGGICISGTAYDQVHNKVDMKFADLGEQQVKNIQAPVRVYAVRAEGLEGVDTGPPAPQIDGGPRRSDKPSIAVLPLNNMSGDPDQEFFADGITEDIITELSRFRELFVISRNSAFKYKNQPVNIAEFAKTLGVQFVVEGSVRKAGDRVRVTVQLIDAETDGHIWAERYDRELKDIFEIQDEITSTIVATLPGRLEAATHDRVKRKLTDNMAAYECLLTGKILHHRSSKETNEEALRILDRAIELDPKYAHAHAWRACTLGQSWVHNWCADRDQTWEQIGAELKLALALDDNDSDVHRILAAVCVAHEEHDKAVYHQDRALALNPNDDLVVVQQGEILTWIGQPEEGIEWIRKAMRRNPYHPERYWAHLGRAQFVARQYDQAINALRHITAPDETHHAILAASFAELGDAESASAHADEIRKLIPKFSTDVYLETQHYKRDEDRAHHRDAMLKAGLRP
ncbi:MAG: adenylate/guanylate cyclase domain-containing protein [Alphaproteobacteria bacterium]|nr:adenylate/guanylate cyclase domain-containing protein [Alphaproteobacteria bacterium]